MGLQVIPALTGALGDGVSGDDTGAIERFVVQVRNWGAAPYCYSPFVPPPLPALPVPPSLVAAALTPKAQLTMLRRLWFHHALQTLGTLAVDAETVASIVQALFTRLKHWGESAASASKAAENAECIAKTIHDLASSTLIAQKALLQTFVLPSFKLYCGSESVCKDVGSGVLLRPAVVAAITGTIRKSCQRMDGAPEQEMLDHVLKIFTRGELDSLGLPATHRAVVSGTAPSDRHLIRLMSAAVCPLSRDLAGSDEVLLLAETFLEFAVKVEHPDSVTAAALAAACIFNKLESGDGLTVKLEQAMSFLGEFPSARLFFGFWKCPSIIRGMQRPKFLPPQPTAVLRPSLGTIATPPWPLRAPTLQTTRVSVPVFGRWGPSRPALPG